MSFPAVHCLYVSMLFNSDYSTTHQLQIVQRCLQEFVGPSPVIEMVSFTNWAQVVSYDHVFVAKPKSSEEIQRIVRAALSYRRQVRAMGSSHSISPLYGDRGQIYLNLTDLTLDDGQTVVLKPAGPSDTHATVRVAAGLSQGNFDQELDILGYHFPYGPVIIEPHIGGALGTGSHAGFYNSASVGAFLVGARLVDGWGNIRVFSEDTHPEVMKAQRCNLGLLGILFEVELKVIPQVSVVHKNVFTPLRNLYDPNFLRGVVAGNYHVNIWHDPYNSLTEKEAQEVLKTGLVPETWDCGNDLAMLELVNPVSSPATIQIKDERPSSYNVTVVSQGQAVFKTRLALPPTRVVPLHKAVHGPAWPYNLVITEYDFPDPDFTASAAAIRSLASTLNHESRKDGVQNLHDNLFRWVRSTICHLCATSLPSAWIRVPSGQLAATGDVFGTLNLESRWTNSNELQRSKDIFTKEYH
ncbi:uncharacterized protein LOC106162851 [Lingula anatina]|uniref:Uncharacterized protein LOC106162851 n=1 Tax=Lingula anatina TaxID=7574 RepID=A0A1S3ID00_LINAN|nr:uncharacterized protein LOC106162851 [Lingula anatina]|eukprot:XP_013395736.1 uncharacterized protein LOC106162851 [Lingula anatina]